jgi:hypothetical protein
MSKQAVTDYSNINVTISALVRECNKSIRAISRGALWAWFNDDLAMQEKVTEALRVLHRCKEDLAPLGKTLGAYKKTQTKTQTRSKS